MPKVRHKFDCGHKGFGTKCHTCEGLANHTLFEVPDPDKPGKTKIVCPKADERRAYIKKYVPEEAKKAEAEDLQRAMTSGKKK